MDAQATGCAAWVKAILIALDADEIGRRHLSPQFIRGLPVCLPQPARPHWRNAPMNSYRSSLMKVQTLLAERGEQITNWLAVLVLLAVGVVWLPG
jgi:hypothetical protein